MLLRYFKQLRTERQKFNNTLVHELVPANIACSKSIIKTLEKGVKYVQS